MRSEQEAMLVLLDKALASTSNSQTIGRNGEIPLLDFFIRYLPYPFRAVTGHFITPSGELSPQIDVMILDARYPLLAENADRSVLAMLHSLIWTIEVKTRITTQDIEKMWKDSITIMKLASEIEIYGEVGAWGSVATNGFAYRNRHSLDALERKYIQVGKPQNSSLDIYILQVSNTGLPQEIGWNLHFEPPYEEVENDTFWPIVSPHHTILSDLYYSLIQNSYYTLATRNFNYGDIGRHIMQYMNWSTYLEEDN
jgi:hypothetical protein